MPRYAPIGQKKAYKVRAKRGQREGAAITRLALRSQEIEKSIQRAKRRDRAFNRDLLKLSRMPQFDDRDQANAEALIQRLQEMTRGKGYVDRIVTNDETVDMRGAAGSYMPFSGGQISLGSDNDIGGNPKEDFSFTKEQLATLSPRGKKFAQKGLNSPASKRSAVDSKQDAKKTLMHEYAHALQFATPGGVANPEWFTEGAAEIKARKLWKQLHPKSEVPHKSYDGYVKKVKRYRKRYGKNATPYKRSSKVLGVPLDPEMAANYLGYNALKMVPAEIGDPIWDLNERIGKLFG